MSPNKVFLQQIVSERTPFTSKVPYTLSRADELISLHFAVAKIDKLFLGFVCTTLFTTL